MNYGEFAIIKTKIGVNIFKVSEKEFVSCTNDEAYVIVLRRGLY